MRKAKGQASSWVTDRKKAKVWQWINRNKIHLPQTRLLTQVKSWNMEARGKRKHQCSLRKAKVN
jgi:hypothetical protein